jgi:hypothetical protein
MDQLLGLFYSLTADPAGMQAVTIGGVALVTLLLLWMIGSGLAGSTAKSRKRQDVQLRAADSLSRLYGEVATAGKSGAQQASTTCEALTLQLCSGRTLGKPDMAALQAIRQLVLGGGSLDMAKFSEHALSLSRALNGGALNAAPSPKLALKQLHDAVGSKPAAPAAARPPVSAPAAGPAAASTPIATVVAATSSVPAVLVPDKI